MIETGDICSNRHLNNPRSVEANTRADKAQQRRRILDVLSRGPRTCEEIARELGTFPNRISGRFKAMREEGSIEYTGERRGNANVYRLTSPA